MEEPTTSISLLARLQHSGEVAAWDRFVELYTPMIHLWTRGQGLSSADADDLAQEVMKTLILKLPTFQYSPEKSFRGWLRTVTINKTRDFFRRRAARREKLGAEISEPDCNPDSVTFFEVAEYQAHLVARALQIMQTEFRPKTWKACWRHVVDDCSASQVASELHMTVNAVYIAKSRVLMRLREELGPMLD